MNINVPSKLVKFAVFFVILYGLLSLLFLDLFWIFEKPNVRDQVTILKHIIRFVFVAVIVLALWLEDWKFGDKK